MDYTLAGYGRHNVGLKAYKYMIIEYNDPNSYWMKNGYSNKPSDEQVVFGCFYIVAFAVLLIIALVVFYIFS